MIYLVFYACVARFGGFGIIREPYPIKASPPNTGTNKEFPRTVLVGRRPCPPRHLSTLGDQANINLPGLELRLRVF